MTKEMMNPIYYEQEEDSRIPEGYGIDESYDGSFYAYQWGGPPDWLLPCYFTDDQGFDQPYPTYEAALQAILRKESSVSEPL